MINFSRNSHFSSSEKLWIEGFVPKMEMSQNMYSTLNWDIFIQIRGELEKFQIVRRIVLYMYQTP